MDPKLIVEGAGLLVGIKIAIDVNKIASTVSDGSGTTGRPKPKLNVASDPTPPGKTEDEKV